MAALLQSHTRARRVWVRCVDDKARPNSRDSGETYAGRPGQLVWQIGYLYQPVWFLIGNYQRAACDADDALAAQDETAGSAMGKQIFARRCVELNVVAAVIALQALVEDDNCRPLTYRCSAAVGKHRAVQVVVHSGRGCDLERRCVSTGNIAKGRAAISAAREHHVAAVAKTGSLNTREHVHIIVRAGARSIDGKENLAH